MIFAKKAIRRRTNRKVRNGRVEKAQLLQSRGVGFFVFFPFLKKRTGRRLSFGSFFGRRAGRQSSLIRSFTTSPASISPTTGGTKEMLPGGTRPLVGSGAPCGFFGISSE